MGTPKSHRSKASSSIVWLESQTHLSWKSIANSTEETCDITFSPPKGNDSVVGGATGNQHAEEQVGTENKTDGLRPRPTLKFPKLPTQVILHSDFKNVIRI